MLCLKTKGHLLSEQAFHGIKGGCTSMGSRAFKHCVLAQSNDMLRT